MNLSSFSSYQKLCGKRFIF